MYARVTTAQVKPGKMNEAISIMKDKTHPTHRSQQGFKSAILLTDPKTGKAVSITLWETEADATGAAPANNLRSAGLLTDHAVREIFEVNFQV